MRIGKKNILFCEISPTTYAISEEKESLLKHIRELFSDEKIARNKSRKKLRNVVSKKDSELIKTGKGIDPVLQENKAVNIDLACKKTQWACNSPGRDFFFLADHRQNNKEEGV